MWLRKILADSSEHVPDSTIIHYGSQSCVKISKNLVFHEKISENLVFHDKSNHIEIKYHYIRDMVQRKEVLVQEIPIDEQVTDVLTKTG